MRFDPIDHFFEQLGSVRGLGRYEEIEGKGVVEGGEGNDLRIAVQPKPEIPARPGQVQGR